MLTLQTLAAQALDTIPTVPVPIVTRAVLIEDSRHLPIYPDESKKAGEYGLVILSGTVKATGELTDLKVKTSSGYARLDNAVLDAVKYWRYKPATRDGQAIDETRTIPYPFVLPDPDTEVEVDLNNQRNNLPPKYPALSKRLRETGTTLITVLVGESGNVKFTFLRKSSGFVRLDNAAIEAVSTWHFNPATKNGKPIDGVASFPVRFDLTYGESNPVKAKASSELPVERKERDF